MSATETAGGENEMIPVIPLENLTFVHLIQVDNFLFEEGKIYKACDPVNPAEIERIALEKVHHDPIAKKSSETKLTPSQKNVCPLCSKPFSHKFLGKIRNISTVLLFNFNKSTGMVLYSKYTG
jgi:hypothetical protein